MAEDLGDVFFLFWRKSLLVNVPLFAVLGPDHMLSRIGQTTVCASLGLAPTTDSPQARASVHVTQLHNAARDME
jgi:hypothetical protein